MVWCANVFVVAADFNRHVSKLNTLKCAAAADSVSRNAWCDGATSVSKPSMIMVVVGCSGAELPTHGAIFRFLFRMQPDRSRKSCAIRRYRKLDEIHTYIGCVRQMYVAMKTHEGRERGQKEKERRKEKRKRKTVKLSGNRKYI